MVIIRANYVLSRLRTPLIRLIKRCAEQSARKAPPPLSPPGSSPAKARKQNSGVHSLNNQRPHHRSSRLKRPPISDPPPITTARRRPAPAITRRYWHRHREYPPHDNARNRRTQPAQHVGEHDKSRVFTPAFFAARMLIPTASKTSPAPFCGSTARTGEVSAPNNDWCWQEQQRSTAEPGEIRELNVTICPEVISCATPRPATSGSGWRQTAEF